VLDLGLLLDRVHGKVRAVSALLDAVGQLVDQEDVGVHRKRPQVEPVGDPERPAHVTGSDRGRQPVAEPLAQAIVSSTSEGGWTVTTGPKTSRGSRSDPCPARRTTVGRHRNPRRQPAGTFGPIPVQKPVNWLQLLRPGHRAHLCRLVAGTSPLHRLHRRDQLRKQLVLHGGTVQDPGGCGAVKGRADIMKLISEDRGSQLGTFNGHLARYPRRGPEAHRLLSLRRLGGVLQGSLDRVRAERQLSYPSSPLAPAVGSPTRLRGCATIATTWRSTRSGPSRWTTPRATSCAPSTTSQL
jgi:hypothetical protein